MDRFTVKPVVRRNFFSFSGFFSGFRGDSTGTREAVARATNNHKRFIHIIIILANDRNVIKLDCERCVGRKLDLERAIESCSKMGQEIDIKKMKGKVQTD